MRLHSVVASASIALLGFGLGNARAIAQTIYPFEAIFNVESTGVPIIGDVLQVSDIGSSANAPYGLTNLVNSNYALFNPAKTNVITVSPDAATYGLQGFPMGRLTLFGQGSDKLFGTETGSSTYDFENLVGTGTYSIKITGGEGRFTGAKGILNFLDNAILSPDPDAPIKGTWFVKGSFQTVPEPSTNKSLIGMGIIGVGFLVYSRRSCKVAKNKRYF